MSGHDANYVMQQVYDPDLQAFRVTGDAGGSGAPTDASYVTTESESGLSNEKLLSTVIGYGDVASRPAAGTGGRLYYASDTQILYRDNGSSWDILATGGTAITAHDVTTDTVQGDTDVDPMRVLRLPDTLDNLAGIAFGIEGEDYPRLVIGADGKLWGGNGTADPMGSGTPVWITNAEGRTQLYDLEATSRLISPVVTDLAPVSFGSIVDAPEFRFAFFDTAGAGGAMVAGGTDVQGKWGFTVLSGGNNSPGNVVAMFQEDALGGCQLRWRFALKSTTLTLANGANNNVTHPAQSIAHITGPTGAFSITGIDITPSTSGGGYNTDTGIVDGSILKLVNQTGQTMTIAHESTSSTAAHRIQTLAGADLVLAGASTVTLIYKKSANRWIATDVSQPLVVGTNVQAWDADLDAIAAITTTSYGRALLALADQAALRNAVGAPQEVSYYLPGPQSPVASISTSASLFSSNTPPSSLFAANSLAVGDLIRIRAAGELFNQSGGNANMQVQIVVGGKQWAITPSVSIGTAAGSTRKWVIDTTFVVKAIGAYLTSSIGGYQFANTSGAGNSQLVVANSYAGDTTASFDTTSNAALDVLVISDVNNALTTGTLKSLSVEKVKS